MTDKYSVMANTPGYSISIKALDEVSAVVARVNKALKDLEAQDQSADAASTQNARRTKNRFDELNKGVTSFGKNARAELLALTRNFADVGGKIGMTIDKLGKAFDLGGIAVGASLAIKSIEGMGEAFRSASLDAQHMMQAAAGAGLDPSRLQRFEAMAGHYGFGSEDADAMMKKIADWKFSAAQGRLPGNIMKMLQDVGINDITKLDPDVVFDKIVREYFKPNSKLSQRPGGARQLGAEFFNNPDFERFIQRGEEFYNKQTEAARNFTVESEKALKAFQKMDDFVNDMWQKFKEIGNIGKNVFGEFAADHPYAAGASVGGAGILTGIAGWKIGKWLTGGILGWIGKSLGLGGAAEAGAAGAAGAATGTEVAAGISFLGWLGRLALGGIGAGLTAGLGTFFGGWFGGGHIDAGEDERVRKQNEEWRRTHPGSAPQQVDPATLTPEQAQRVLDSGYNLSPEMRDKLQTRARGGAVAPIAPAVPSSSSLPSNVAVQTAFAQSGLPTEAQAFMRDIASGEAIAFDQMAGDRAGGGMEQYGDRTGYAGFPDWQGMQHEYRGRMVTSHGAGLFQDEPGTWKSIAAGTGLTNFRDPQQQIAGNWWWAQKTYRDASGRDLLTDLKSGNLDPRGRAALGTQWARGSLAGGSRYQQFLKDTQSLPTPSLPIQPPAAAPAQPAQPTDSSSHHSVEVAFLNMPAGSRTSVTQQTGDADLTLRTRYAMGVV